MKCKLALAILLILSLTLMTGFCGQVQAQAQYSLDLQGITWNHSTIRVLVVPQDDASWWKPSYLNATLRSIAEWNNAVQAFALNYSNFAYLSELRMVPTVSHALSYSFDVYVSWTQALSASADEIGLTTTTYGSSGMIINSTIRLAAEDSRGDVLKEVDMQNVALHELGHSLGLRHSSYSGDVMYPRLALNHPVEGLSTLDLFGVSTVFQWMSNSSNPPYSPQQSSLTLPSTITYLYLPISYENLPPPTLSPTPSPALPSGLSQTLSTYGQTVLTLGQTLLTYILQFFFHPGILISLLIAISAVLVTEFLVARITHKSTRRERLD
jgi:hypothetical protein